MPDMEKTIKGLESLRIRLLDIAMQDSIFMLDVSMVENAIAMLKEQEAVEPFFDEYVNPRCGKCHRRLFCVDDRDSFCSKCGQAVKWE